MICDEIIEKLRKYDRIGVAVSGGMDSMALLHYLYFNDFDIIAVNVEHGIRGERSEEDSEFVRDYCAKYSIPCKVFRIDAPSYAKNNGYTLEQAARILRHAIFKEFAEKHGIPIAAAHHKSDQAESIFMHIARGSGVDGLVGMGFQSGHLIRPLIETDKKTIEEYVRRHEVPFVEDETNADESYSRNYVRCTVFPTIEAKYPNFTDSIVKIGRRAKEIQELVAEFAPRVEENCGAKIVNLRGVKPILAAASIKKACAELGVMSDIEERHIEALLALPNGKFTDLPHGLTAYGEYGKLAIAKTESKDLREYPIDSEACGFGYGNLETVIADKAIDGYRQLDYNKITGAAIRTRRDGDKIELSFGRKNVSDILTDGKIPLRLKDKVPLIAVGSEIAAVGDLETAEKFRINAETSKILNFRWVREPSSGDKR